MRCLGCQPDQHRDDGADKRDTDNLDMDGATGVQNMDRATGIQKRGNPSKVSLVAWPLFSATLISLFSTQCGVLGEETQSPYRPCWR